MKPHRVPLSFRKDLLHYSQTKIILISSFFPAYFGHGKARKIVKNVGIWEKKGNTL